MEMWKSTKRISTFPHASQRGLDFGGRFIENTKILLGVVISCFRGSSCFRVFVAVDFVVSWLTAGPAAPD
jgi:hypothetical protein